MTPKVDIPFEDQETTINYAKHVIGEWCEVYSTDKVVMKRYKKFCDEHPEYCKLVKEDKYSMTFSVHPKCASLYPKAPRKVTITDEQRDQLRKQIAEIRNKKKSPE